MAGDAPAAPVVSNLLVGPAVGNLLDDTRITFGFLEYRPPLRYKGIGLWASVEASGRERYLGVGLFYGYSLGE